MYQISSPVYSLRLEMCGKLIGYLNVIIIFIVLFYFIILFTFFVQKAFK